MIQGQKAWDYSHTDHAWPVCHVFMPGSKQLNDHPILKQNLSLIQQVESNNHLRGGIVNVYNNHETSWIIAMHKLGYRYACIWFDGAWADTERFNLALLTEIDRLAQASDNEWMCAGEIQTRDGEYPFFARSLMLLKLDAWLAADQPNPYITPSENPEWVSLDNSRDWEDSVYGVFNGLENTQPRNLSIAECDFSKQQQFGNAWISWSLRRRLTVPGIGPGLMNHVTYTRPHVGTGEFEKGIQGLPYDKTAVSYRAKRSCDLIDVGSPVYFVNTEPSQPEIAEQLSDSGFDQYVGAQAGFKLLYYAYKYGITHNTRFVFYDFDTKSCQFRRDTLAEWDGEDYVSWVNTWCERNPDANQDLKYLVAERWPTVVDQFGGQASWLEFWNRVRKLDNQVIQCDIITNSQYLLDQLNTTRTFLWTSNIYSYIVAKLIAKPFQLESSFISLITKLNELHPDCWFSGTDINDNDLMCPSRAILTVGENRNIGFE
jgi:hypothetical protein